MLNVSYSLLAENRNEEELEHFDEEIGMRVNPREEAQEALRAYQEAAGLVFENPDAVVEAPLENRDEEIPGAWMGKSQGGKSRG